MGTTIPQNLNSEELLSCCEHTVDRVRLYAQFYAPNISFLRKATTSQLLYRNPKEVVPSKGSGHLPKKLMLVAKKHNLDNLIGMTHQYRIRGFIALIVFIIIQIIFIPLAIIGLILIAIKQVLISKKLGVSGTAISVIGGRWIMDVFGMRKDTATIKLYSVLPNGSVFGLWLLLFPSYIRYKISGKNKGYPLWDEEGKESLIKVVFTRTIHFDKLINKSKDKLSNLLFWEPGTIRDAMENLKKAI